jgi:predicted nucleotidyltransferase
LIKEIVGNVHLYKLNNELELVKHLKIVHTLLEFEQQRFTEYFLDEDNMVSSIVLYGSYANGENDSKSDIDLLLLVNKKRSYTTVLQTLEKKFHKQISLQQMTISEWQTLKKKDKIFYESLLEKHIILYGSGLP